MDRKLTNRRVKTVLISLIITSDFVSPFAIISKHGIRRRRPSNECQRTIRHDADSMQTQRNIVVTKCQRTVS